MSRRSPLVLLGATLLAVVLFGIRAVAQSETPLAGHTRPDNPASGAELRRRRA